MCNDEIEDYVCGERCILCLKTIRVCLICVVVAGFVVFMPAMAFDRVHKTHWQRLHSIASWTDTLQALTTRRETSRAELVKRSRLKLWRTAAHRTRLQCWDHRPLCSSASLSSSHRTRRLAGCTRRKVDPNASVLLRPVDLLPSDLSLSVVGNGMSSSNASAKVIDSSDVVVRFNDFMLAPGITGSRTDVHTMNGNIHGDRACRAPINIFLECQFRVEKPPDACRTRQALACVATPSSFDQLCHGAQAGADPSRGFLVLSMFRRDPQRVKLFGFRGRGHWYDAARRAKLDPPNVRVRDPRRWRQAHHVEVEHELLRGDFGKEVASLVV